MTTIRPFLILHLAGGGATKVMSRPSSNYFINPGSCRPIAEACIDPVTGVAVLRAEAVEDPTVPPGFQIIYLLARTERQLIETLGTEPAFEVSIGGQYSIHALVYDPAATDLAIAVQFLW